MKTLLDRIWSTEENDVIEIQVMSINCLVVSCGGGTNPPPPPPPPGTKTTACAVPY